tara:strand:- start:3156 stop:3491 length:336 start_codon:yes stop_codon:yes gene_type:complete
MIDLEAARPDPNKRHGVALMTLPELKHISATLNNGRLIGRQLNLAGLAGVSSHGVVTKWFQKPASMPIPTVRLLRAMYLAKIGAPAGTGPGGVVHFLQSTAEAIDYPTDAI